VKSLPLQVIFGKYVIFESYSVGNKVERRTMKLTTD
jgi:hypothetical protein